MINRNSDTHLTKPSKRSYNFKDKRIQIKWSHNDTHIDFYIRAIHLGYIGFGIGEHSGMKNGELIGKIDFKMSKYIIFIVLNGPKLFQYEGKSSNQKPLSTGLCPNYHVELV